MERDYSLLMNLADQLEAFQGFLTTEEVNQKGKVRAAFNSARNDFVYKSLGTGEAGEDVRSSIASEIETMEKLQPHWGGTYAFVREEIFGRLDKETRKTPLLRKLAYWTPVAIFVAFLIAYFSVRIFSAGEVTSPITSKPGLIQRAAAFQRVVRFEEMAPTGYGTRSLAKAILRWPIEPSKEELAGAQEFVSLTLSGHQKLFDDKAICGSLIGGEKGGLSEQQFDLIQSVAEYLRKDDAVWKNPPVMTVLDPIANAFPCS